MKKPAKISMYIALVGFAVTVIANLLHRPDIAFYIFISSLVFLLAGIIIFLLNKSSLINSAKMASTKKIALIIICLSASIVILGLMVSIQGMHHTGKAITSFGLLGCIPGYALLMFGPYGPRKYILKPDIYQQSKLLRIVLGLTIIFMLIGLLLKIQHYPGGMIIVQTGFALFILFLMISLFSQVITKKKQPLLDIKTIELTSAELDQYLGVYFNEQMKMDIVVTKNDTGTGLIAKATKQDSFPLYPIEKNIFNYDRAALVMEFKPEENKFILIQSGGYFPFIKKN